MMEYVIKRTDDGLYVADGSIEQSFTNDIRQAARFATRDLADAARCKGNEAVFSLESQFSSAVKHTI